MDHLDLGCVDGDPGGLPRLRTEACACRRDTYISSLVRIITSNTINRYYNTSASGLIKGTRNDITCRAEMPSSRLHARPSRTNTSRAPDKLMLCARHHGSSPIDMVCFRRWIVLLLCPCWLVVIDEAVHKHSAPKNSLDLPNAPASD